jgi:hypothetical protein
VYFIWEADRQKASQLHYGFSDDSHFTYPKSFHMHYTVA